MNHDITSLMGQRIMQKNSLAMKRSLEKLSTGLRTKIPDMDNTAGVAVGEVMRSRIFGIEKALNNTQDGISLIQTATGALESTQSMLMRMRELSVQAANDTLTQQDRSYIQVEVNEIRNEIDRIGSTTQFNRKKILSGDNAALWSSTDNNVKAIIHGGLRAVDEYGQKYSVEGNYKISVSAVAGKAETQKSDIFRIKHDDIVTNKALNVKAGVKDVEVSGNVAAGNYSLNLSEGSADEVKVTGHFGVGGFNEEEETQYNFDDVFSFDVSDGMTENASILFEVKSVNSQTKTVTLKASAEILTQEGTTRRAVMDNILLRGADPDEGRNEGTTVELDKLFGNDSFSITLNTADYVNEGAMFSVNVSAQTPVENSIGIDLSGMIDTSIPDKWDNAPFSGETLHYVLNGDVTANKEINFTNYFVNSRTGTASTGTITLKTSDTFKSVNSNGQLDTSEQTTLANFDVNYVGKVANGDTRLRDIDKFWDAQGVFILTEPKELTLTQGDGKQAKIMLQADDTLNDVALKLNRAVAIGLGQSKYVDDISKFVSFVEGGTKGFESVGGTFVINSALAGSMGEITLSGNEDVLKAFSLNTIQKSEENQYDVTVRDAHTGDLIAERVKITGNRLIGVIHKNIDVEFDPTLGINISWNDATKKFDFNDNTNGKGSEVTLHVADNTTVLQTGTAEGEDVILNIGDMRSHALGLDGINVMSQERAAKSIELIDLAIDKVSMQQAKLGGAQTRLEHHIGNLTSELEALTDATSTIRDVDYAKEIMEFTRIRILMESNSAMLAQSNAIQQQSILSIMRN